MSKLYTSHHLVQKYKNIKSIIEYHKILVSEIELTNYLEDNLIDAQDELEYHAIQIQNFEDELKEILLRKDFNEEYAICFIKEDTNMTSILMIGEDSYQGSSDDSISLCCCVIS